MTYPAGLCVLLTKNVDDTDQSTYTTASITVPDNELILLFYTIRGTSATPAVPTINRHTGGASAGFTSIASVSNAGTNMRTGVFRYLGTGFTDSLDIVGGSTPIGCHWSVILVAGCDRGGTNGANAIVQSGATTFASSTSRNPVGDSLVAAAKVSNGFIFCAKHDNGNADAVSGTGAALLSDSSGAAPVHTMGVAATFNDGTHVNNPILTWTGSANGATVSVEVKTIDTKGSVVSYD